MTPNLYLGDCLEIMRELPDKSVDLIATDPPFNTGSRWEHKAGGFDDKFRNTREFMSFMTARCKEMYRLLAPTGSLYLHCDQNASHYLKVMLDKIFGEKNFRGEIVWRIGWVSGYKTAKKGWIRNHDTILYYAKSAEFTFNKFYKPKTREYLAGFDRRDEHGRAYRRLQGEGDRRLYMDDAKGIPIDDVWNGSEDDRLHSLMICMTGELRGYPTQKPLALYERIIAASSKKNDTILDPFCGSGTTIVAAHRLGRRGIGIDKSEDAIACAKGRVDEITAQGLLDIE